MQYRTKGLAPCCGEEAKMNQHSRENRGARFSCWCIVSLDLPWKCLGNVCSGTECWQMSLELSSDICWALLPPAPFFPSHGVTLCSLSLAFSHVESVTAPWSVARSVRFLLLCHSPPSFDGWLDLASVFHIKLSLMSFHSWEALKVVAGFWLSLLKKASEEGERLQGLQFPVLTFPCAVELDFWPCSYLGFNRKKIKIVIM